MTTRGQPEHLLLDWVTGSMGVWELTLELGDAGKSVIYSAPPVTMVIDNTAPTTTPFPTLFQWRYAGTSGWTNRDPSVHRNLSTENNSPTNSRVS